MHQLKLRQFLNDIYEMPDKSFQLLIKTMEEVQYTKDEVITKEGEIEKYLYIVLEGYQRFYIEEEGQKNIIAFSSPLSFSGIPQSFLIRRPSKYWLSCITESHLLRIANKELVHLLTQDNHILELIRRTTGVVISNLVDQYYQLMSMTMEERFKSYMSDNTHLLQVIPRRELASFLNIDYTNFSKLMGKVRL